METKHTDLYTRVTESIVAQLERGVRPWQRPWATEHAEGRVVRPLRCNGTPYRGINVLLLWQAACERGYSAPTWCSFRQARELGGHVRTGEKGSLVVYADRLTRTEDGPGGEEEEREIFFMRGYTVFNVEQVEGLPPDLHRLPERSVATPAERIRGADRFFAASGADIRHGGLQAYYAPSADYIQMPPFELFKDAEGYAATLAHEMTHWTRHESRLDRDLGRQTWGDAGYAREELVAEIGAAFLCSDLGISPTVRDDHASYLASWLRVLKEDKRAICRAAAHAQKAVDYLHALQPVPV